MGDIERLVRIYRAAGREVTSALDSVDPSDYKPERAADALRKVAGTVKALNLATDRWVDEAVDRSYSRGARTAKTALEILGKKEKRPLSVDRRKKLKDDVSLTLIRANNSINLVAQKFLALTAMASREIASVNVKGQLQEFSFSEAEGTIGKMARDTVAGEGTRRELAGQVRGYLRGVIGEDQFIEINGRMFDVKKYSMLVARTTLREAQTAATKDLCAQYDNDLVQWSDHGTICEECKPYEGEIYSISGSDPTYPPLEEEPPIHPNCEHSLLPTTPEAIETRRAGFLPPHVPGPSPAPGPAPEPGPAPVKARKPRAPRKVKPQPTPAAPPTVPAVQGANAYERWVPATTIKEAEDWAKKELLAPGSYGNVSYKGLPVEMANVINREMAWMTRSGYTFSEVGPGRSGRAVMWVNKGSISVEKINPQGGTYWGRRPSIEFHYNKQYFTSVADTQKMIDGWSRTGWQLNHDLSSLVQHELAHVLDGSYMNAQGNMYWRWSEQGTRSRELYDHWASQFRNSKELLDAKAWIRNRSSGDYMWVLEKGTKHQNYDEFFAESYRLYRQGRLPSSMEDFDSIFKGWGW